MTDQNEHSNNAVPPKDEEEAQKSRRRPRRSPAKKKLSAEVSTESSIEAPANTESAEALTVPATTPARRRTRKPKAPDRDVTAPTDAPDTSAEHHAAAEIPLPAAASSLEAAVPTEDSGLPGAEGVARKRRRRRRRNKKPHAAESASPSAETAAPLAEDKPAAHEDEWIAPASVGEETEPGREKSRRRRRKRKGKKPQPSAELTHPETSLDSAAETPVVQDATKRILINARFPEEQRVAIVEGKRLMDFYAESSSRVHLKGNIYKGVVEGLAPSLQAAFIDFGRKKRGFLQFREVMPELRRGDSVLEEGQEILVQVEQDERDMKGASLTTYISLPGRYIVMLPGQTKVGISRKIEDRSDRDRLKETFNSLKLPKGMGFILRTACGDSLDEELDRDLKYLTKLWSRISSDAKKGKAPKLVYQEHSVTMRALRDYLTSDTAEILIDDEETFKATKSFLQKIMPWRTVNITHYAEKDPLFGGYGVEKQIAELMNSRVKLPSGGTIVFDKAEALTAIDVNSAKSHKEDNIEATALSTNLEAAEEIARQLRLRDIGGLVVIDFIDMRSGRNRSMVETRLKECMSTDKANIEVLPISRFGLLEMTRERLRPAYAAAMWRSCQTCSGRGAVYSDEHVMLNALRELHALAENNAGSTLRCHLPIESANLLSNTRRQDLNALEQQYQVSVQIIADKSVHPGQYSLEVKKHK